MFHRVSAQLDPLFPETMTVGRFDEICRWASELFNVLPLDEAAERLVDGSLPHRALAITLDDGYADNHDIALPVLRRHRLSATLFVATAFLEGAMMWNEQAQVIPI
jgi:peptidoglycan/xylan/chitin deacetylase (PgdA/CDA1 family)